MSGADARSGARAPRGAAPSAAPGAGGPALPADLRAAVAAALDAVRAHAAADAGVVSARGVEALVAGVGAGAPRSAWLLPGPRERAVALVRGATADRLDEARPYRVVPAGPSPAARALYAVGLALAGDPAVVFLGTGSAGYGAFQSALHLAAAHRAPVTFVVGWYTTPGPFAAPLPVEPAALARALGLGAAVVDGTDAAAVCAAVAGAEGPTLVQANLAGRS